MTPYALILIGNAGSGMLKTCHIDLVCSVLTDPRVVWLADNEACEILFDSTFSAAELTLQARKVMDQLNIDAVCVPAVGRRKRLLVSDMDSTIIEQECIDELGDAFGVGEEIRAVTAEVVNGNMGFSEALRKRLALMKGMDISLLAEVYEKRITLQPGARVFVQTMRKHGAHCVLVSGGFSFFTGKIADRVGFHDHRGNELIFENGKLTGEVVEPILGRSAKLETLTRCCAKIGVTASDVLAVGDGANDMKMVAAAGLGVAYHGADALKKQGDACIDFCGLNALLYIQGYHCFEHAAT